VLRLFLVGRVAAEYADEPLRMPSSERARALIGWLGLHPGLHPRQTVATSLWPDADEEQVRARLRTTVWALRQAWGSAGDVLVGTRDSLGFLREALTVDAYADPGPGLPLPDGELLPGLADEWAAAAREEYRDRQIERLQALAEQAEREGRTRAAVEWARRRSVLARWDESAHRDLLRALLADDDYAAAADEARRFRTRLREELGVEPSAATRSAQAAVQQGRTIPQRPAIFGRSADLKALTSAWQAALAGRGRVLVVVGEAGIGKTTLAIELARRAAQAGGRIAVGSGLDVGGATPFATWLEMARALATTAPAVPASQSWPTELNRLSPELGPALGRSATATPVASPELERLRVFDSSLRLVEWAARDKPVLLVVDDAHRADRASVQLVAHLARRVSALPILLVLACRDRPQRPAIDELLTAAARAGVPVSRVELGPLDDAGIAALASSLGVTEVERVVSAAEGTRCWPPRRLGPWPQSPPTHPRTSGSPSGRPSAS
jgi:DNA-binding SARP family transcriptional activator